jgi:acetyl-CoA acetyltransferase
MRKVAVIGVGLHPYGKFNDKKPKDLAATAISSALTHAGLAWKDVQSAFCGHINLGMTAGARLLEPIGQTGLSITNVENASASGSYAFRGAYFDVASGEFDIALALGVDMLPRPKAVVPAPAEASGSAEKKPPRPASGPMLKFAQDAQAHMKKYGTTLDQLAQVSVKQHYNGARNPFAHYQEEVTLEQVHSARMVADPLTVLHCCPMGDGAAAAIVVSEDVVKRLGIKHPIWITASVSQSVRAETPELTALTESTAREAYKRAGIGPEDLGLVELHDAATIEEIIYVESLGLCAEGQGGKLIEEGATEITGRIPVNTSGGLLAMGHPFGPTGIGQIAEIFWQLRGEAGKRQIPTPPKVGLAHMIGMGGTCIVHVLQR